MISASWLSINFFVTRRNTHRKSSPKRAFSFFQKESLPSPLRPACPLARRVGRCDASQGACVSRLLAWLRSLPLGLLVGLLADQGAVVSDYGNFPAECIAHTEWASVFFVAIENRLQPLRDFGLVTEEAGFAELQSQVNDVGLFGDFKNGGPVRSHENVR